MNDEGGLDRLPVRREAGNYGNRCFRRFAACERVRFLIFARKLSCLLIEGAHLDAGPETSEGEPCVMRGIFYVVRVNGIEVVCSHRLEDEAFILPFVIRAGTVERLVRYESNT